jgi:hypothetical protein
MYKYETSRDLLQILSRQFPTSEFSEGYQLSPSVTVGVSYVKGLTASHSEKTESNIKTGTARLVNNHWEGCITELIRETMYLLKFSLATTIHNVATNRRNVSCLLLTGKVKLSRLF